MSGYTPPPGTSILVINGSDLVCQAPCPPATGILTGVAPATLQAWLLTAQTALQTLNTGSSLVSVEYAEGQGQRKAIYKTADASRLASWITQLQRALGVRTRRAIGVRF